MADNSLGFFETDMPGTDNRHYLRQTIIADLDLGEDNAGIVVDLSEGGLRIQAARELPADKVFDLRFQPWELNAWLEARGRIVWTNETKKFAGVEFVSLPEQTRQLLRGFLVKHANDRAIHGAGGNAAVRPVFSAESRANAAAARLGAFSASTTLPKFEIGENRAPSFISDAGRTKRADQPRNWRRIAFTVLFCLIVTAGVWLARSSSLSDNLSGTLQGFQRLISGKQETTQPIAAINVSPASIAIPQVSTPAPEPINSNPPTPASFPLARDLGTVLQVAAMSHEENATALVQSLQENNFPAFALRQGTNPLYKVTVGPYADRRSVDAAKEKLAAHGIEFFEKRWLP